MTCLPFTQLPWSAVVFRLLLVVALWEGPVLWGHTHNADRSALAGHIARFHACDVDPASLGWHWHFSLPDTDGSGRSDDECPVRSYRTALVNFPGSQGQVAEGVGSPQACFDDSSLKSPELPRMVFAGWVSAFVLTINCSPQLLGCLHGRDSPVRCDAADVRVLS